MDAITTPAADLMIENRTFDEIAVGDSASLSHTVTQQDVDLFAILTGEVNPVQSYPRLCQDRPFPSGGGGTVCSALV